MFTASATGRGSPPVACNRSMCLVQDPGVDRVESPSARRCSKVPGGIMSPCSPTIRIRARVNLLAVVRSMMGLAWSHEAVAVEIGFDPVDPGEARLRVVRRTSRCRLGPSVAAELLGVVHREIGVDGISSGERSTLSNTAIPMLALSAICSPPCWSTHGGSRRQALGDDARRGGIARGEQHDDSSHADRATVSDSRSRWRRSEQS